MKAIKLFFLVTALAILAGCEGIPGPPGEDGLDGESFIGSVFEIEGDFTSQNDYQLYFEFPADVEVYESDVVLVYILWEQVTDNAGQPIDVWRLLPQTVVLNEGVLQYNYDHTFADVQIFLEGTINLNDLLPAESMNQVFRIVVLPADFAKSNNLDVSNYNSMMEGLNFNPKQIQKLEFGTN